MRYLPLFILVLILVSCSKEKSKKWLVADVTVIDKWTGEPMECGVVLKWNTSSFGSSTSHFIDLGETDSEGKIRFEREVSRKEDNFRLEIWPDQTHYGFPGLNNTHKTVALEKKSSNVKLLKFPSKSYVVLSIMNTNCTGPTDTLFLRSMHSSYEGPHSEYIGCVDTVINGQMSYAGYIIDPILRLEYIVKRGSQVDTVNETHNLTPKEFTPININY